MSEVPGPAAPDPAGVRGRLRPEAVRVRRELAERAAGRELPHLGGRPVAPAEARGNVENLIGFAQVPVGLAGPLRFVGSDGPVETYVPLATTEGAMVASYSRGMSVLAEAGTLRARTLAEGLSQHPMFVYRDLDSALRAAEVARGALARLRELTGEETRSGSVQGLEPELIGRRLILRLVFSTADAIGINMAARVAERFGTEFAARTEALEFHVHGQDVEKRANARALTQGRGRCVAAEAVLPRPLVEQRLRTDPERLAAIARSYAVGFAALGTQNWTVQSANGIAALYLACGQDVAYVTESATGFLELSPTADGGLYCRRAPAQRPGRQRRRGLGPGDRGGVPGADGVRRRGSGPAPGGDRGRHGPGRRPLAHGGLHRRGVQRRPRAPRAQSAPDRARGPAARELSPRGQRARDAGASGLPGD